MTELPDGFEFSGVYVYRSNDDPETFYYFPTNPGPERSPSGEPMLTLVVTDQNAMLQLGTQWKVETSVLDSLKKVIGDRFSDLNPVLIRFTPAPLSIESVSLVLTGADGREELLQTSQSSGFSPYSAIFNVTLTPEQKAQVASAVNGRTGLLKVIYKSSLSVPMSAEASSTADAGTDVSEPGSERRSESSFRSRAQVTTMTSVPIERSTDIGTWDTGGADSPKIMVAATPATSTAAGKPAAAMVSIGFDMKDVPIAMVQVTWEEQGTISSPVFGPVTVKGRTDKPVSLKVSYTNGAPFYQTNHPAPTDNELKLTPPDLGLALITLDATAWRQAGATQAQIKVNYKPTSGGFADEHVIRLRFGDWTDQWYVVTRSAGLDGMLEIEGTQTNADGTVVEQPTITTDNLEIILSAETPLNT